MKIFSFLSAVIVYMTAVSALTDDEFNQIMANLPETGIKKINYDL